MKISNPIAIKGEEIATIYLKDRKYKIIDRNFRKGYGEIDIIAIKNKVLVFIEVKTRTSYKYGIPLEQITASKLRSLIKTAQFYKLSNPKLPEALRIDAIGVILDLNFELISIEHRENITEF